MSVSSTFPSSAPPSPTFRLAPPPSPLLSPPSWSFPPGADTPATCEVPHFPPLRARGGRYGPLRSLRRRGRVVAVGLAVAAAALVAAGARPGAGPPGDGPARAHPARSADPPPAGADGLGANGVGGLGADAGRTVTAPVRIADAETVRLLRPGDRVDVIAAGDPATDGTARVLARGARVARVPQPATGGAARDESGAGEGGPDGARPVEAGSDGTGPGWAGSGGAESGALVALRVPRATAARLAGASATTRLAVTLW